MKLYSMSGSCALSINITLEWIGKPFEVELVLHGDNRKPAYLAVNPAGQVPALVLDDGVVLTQVAAILTWLVDTHPGARLGASSSEPFERFELAQALSYLTEDVHGAFAPFFGPGRFLDDAALFGDLKKKALQQVAVHIRDLDSKLGDQPFLFTTGRSVADSYLYVLTRWAAYLPDGLTPFPKLAAFRLRMESDPGVQRALVAQKLKPLGG
ncbi:MAG: glutathione S-transferase N-terminal domain-containing protein [Burkholderiaceae bacterium]